jgi:hypothetical protein
MNIAKMIGKWKSAAARAGNLCELELALGKISLAIEFGKESVNYAERSGDWKQRVMRLANYGDALHRGGNRTEAFEQFRSAESIKTGAENKPDAKLCSLAGFYFCDLILARTERAVWRQILDLETAILPSEVDAACAEVVGRSSLQSTQSRREYVSPLDLALNQLTRDRAVLYQAFLGRTTSAASVPAAVDSLRKAGQVQFNPLGLITRACQRFFCGDEVGCRADLAAAKDIAERGSMRLHLADIQLTQARLFRDRAALREAEELIEATGYGRRKEELDDARTAAHRWKAE